jgi:epoxyqueuosine reductase QueG
MLLAQLQGALEAFMATGGNTVQAPGPLASALLEPGPLRLYDPPLLGVADALDPLWDVLKQPDVVGPQHGSPREWLPEARSVVSFFLPYSHQVRRANRTPGWPATEWLYGRYEGGALVEALDNHLARMLREAGWRALAPATDPRLAVAHFRSNWSERHAAFVAGLGTFSLNRSLITRAGAAGRIGSVVTDAPFPATRRPYTGATEHCHACGACIQRCPCGAIDASGKDNVACKAFLDRTLGQYGPRYGCGKCQTGVPCEHEVPAPGGKSH